MSLLCFALGAASACLAGVTVLHALWLLPLAAVLGLDPGRINVKATTEEHLGFTGREEGIACHAVCLLEPAKPE